MTSKRFTGGCLCGAVRYEIGATPRDSHYCHCRMCQRHFGGPFGMYVTVSSSSLVFVKGRPKIHRSSEIAMRGFCADCGSPLTFQYDAVPEQMAIALGSLDEPERFPPRVHWGTEGWLPWLEINDKLPHRTTEEDEEFQALVKSARGDKKER